MADVMAEVMADWPASPQALLGAGADGLKSTEDFLGLGATNPLTFGGNAIKNVRGIDARYWIRDFTLTFFNMTFMGTAAYFDPVTSWSNAGEVQNPPRFPPQIY